MYLYYVFPLALFAAYLLLTTAGAAAFLEQTIPDPLQRRISVGLVLACIAFVLAVALSAV